MKDRIKNHTSRLTSSGAEVLRAVWPPLSAVMGFLQLVASYKEWRGLSLTRGHRQAGYLLGSILSVSALLPLRRTSTRGLALTIPTVALFGALVHAALASLINRALNPAERIAPGKGRDWYCEPVSFPVRGNPAPGLLYVPHQTDGAAICLVHGAGDNKTAFKWKLIESLVRAGFIVLTFDLEGHGENWNSCLTYPHALDDVPAAVDFLCEQPDVDRNRIGVLGISLGGSLAVPAAAHDPRIKSVAVLETPYKLDVGPVVYLTELATSLTPAGLDLFKEATPYHTLQTWRGMDRYEGDPVERLIRDLDVLGHARQLQNKPLLVVHGTRDTAISPSQAVRLYQAASTQHKHLIRVEGANHLTLILNSSTTDAVKRWFSESI